MIGDESARLICYADDTNLINRNRNLDQLVQTGELILGRVIEYFSVNGLLLNIDKPKCVLFGSQRSQLSDIVRINGENVEVAKSTRFLGLTVDAGLKWEEHITELCSKLSKVCYALREIKKYVNEQTLFQMYYGNFYSLLKYVLYFGAERRLQISLKFKKERLELSRGWGGETRVGEFSEVLISLHCQRCTSMSASASWRHTLTISIFLSRKQKNDMLCEQFT